MKFGYLRQDDDSHWYLIPEDKIVDFDDHVVDMEIAEKYKKHYLKLEEEFRKNYGEYRLKVCLEDLKVIIDENI